ncbi:MAG: hypothetical protein H6825_06380 [Planctomycetes bacterium]|nr:hypothetical protein [Planctomycetota bacterium]
MFALLLVGPLEVPASAADETRAKLPLDGTWSMLIDPGDQGLRDGWEWHLAAGRTPPSPPAPSFDVPVPGPLEVHPSVARYDGLAWFSRRFDAPLGRRDSRGRPVRSVLRFGEVNAACRVWIDESEVGSHEGWGPFEIDVTAALHDPGRHSVVVRVLDAGDVETDGITVRTIPHAKETWYHNTGGILGSVELVQHTGAEPRVLRLIADASSGEVRVDVRLDAPEDGPSGATTALELFELPLGARADAARPLAVRAERRATFVDGRAELTLSAFVPQPRAWSPERPFRYVARVTVGTRVEEVAFGFRPLRLDAQGLSLGTASRPLAGVLLQPWFPGLGGRDPGASELEAEVAAIKDAGFDLVRAHVRPAPAAFLDACDRLGLMVLEEPPIGWVDDDPRLLERMAAAVDTMIARDQRHPSIVMWGMLNELSGKAYRYADALVQHAADGDASRPILEDSGAFFGDGRYLPARERELRVMHDEHVYPPYPLPLDEREHMRTLGDGDAGPTFVSEYGYGTLLDVDTIGPDFEDVPVFDPERKLLEAFVETARRVRASGADWSGGKGWVAEAQRLQADAAVDMTEALRANPRLDLLCWTQWQAVSHESSSGLLSPGGRPRPALAALRDALAPLRVEVFADHASARPGEEIGVDVVVVNDTGEGFDAALELRVEGGERTGRVRDPARPGMLLAGPLPTGVTSVSARVRVDEGGALGLTARLVRPRAEVVVSRPALLPVLAARASGAESASVTLALLEDDPAARAFARRVGLRFVEDVDADAFADPSSVVLLSHPHELLAELAFGERVALWSKVRAGGTVIALVDGPRGAVARLFGGARGVQTLDGLPLPLHVASAAGNFMGRIYPVLEGTPADGALRDDRWLFDAGGDAGGPRPEEVPAGRPPLTGWATRLLDRFDGTLTPRAMLVEPLPDGTRPAMLALGHAGDRLGVPVAAVPYGAGRIVFVGVPLLDPVLSAHDARRDGALLQLVLDGAARAREVVPVDAARAAFVRPRLSALDEAALDRTIFELGRVVDVAERESIVAGARQERYDLPPEARAALDAQQAALVAWIEGRPDDGRAVLRAALERLDAQSSSLLGLEQKVLDDLGRLVARGARADLDRAYSALEAWVSGLAFWSAGDLETAFDWLGRAELALRPPVAPPADAPPATSPVEQVR